MDWRSTGNQGTRSGGAGHRIWAGALVSCVALWCASAGNAEYQTRSLDSMPQAETEDPDDLTIPDTTPLDEVDTGRMRPLDEVPTAETEDSDDLAIPDTTSLDDVPLAESRDPDSSDTWSPPACSQVLVHPQGIPQGNDPEAWRQRLAEAEQHSRDLQQQLEAITHEYAGSLGNSSRYAARIALGHERDALRREYSKARCELPRLVEDARRAGVVAEVLRPYQPPAMAR